MRTAPLLAALLATLALGEARARAQEPELPSLPPSTAPDTTAAPAAPAAPARAARLGYVPDTVFLASGGIVRGAVAETRPGDHVTIAMPTGEVRRIPWAEVDHVQLGATPSAPPTTAIAAPPPDARKNGPLVRVHIRSEQPVLLDRRPAGEETWVPACASPCDADLPLGDVYRLSGAGVRATSEFRLSGAEGGQVELSVDAATKRAWWVGAGIGGLGLVLDGYGLYIALLGSLVANQTCGGLYSGSPQSCESSRARGATIRNVGLVMLIPGTAAAIIGGAMMARNFRSGVSQSEAGADAPSRPLDAFTRTPEAKALVPAGVDGPATVWTPLFSGTF